MTTWAPDMTPRYKAGYISAGLLHSLQVRAPRGSTDTETVTIGRNTCQALALAMQALLPDDFHWTEAHFAKQFTSVFLPTTFIPTDPTGAKALSTYTPVQRATETIFQGNGGGSRVTMNLFGVYWDLGDVASPAANGRVETTENATVLAGVAALNAGTGQVSVGNAVVIYSAYANVKINDYWLKRVRKLFP